MLWARSDLFGQFDCIVLKVIALRLDGLISLPIGRTCSCLSALQLVNRLLAWILVHLKAGELTNPKEVYWLLRVCEKKCVRPGSKNKFEQRCLYILLMSLQMIINLIGIFSTLPTTK